MYGRLLFFLHIFIWNIMLLLADLYGYSIYSHANFLLKYSRFKEIRLMTLCTMPSAGYLLADDPQGETPLIPSEVMEFSIKHSTEVDINTTLQILGSPGEKASSIPGCNRTDSVIRYRLLIELLCFIAAWGKKVLCFQNIEEMCRFKTNLNRASFSHCWSSSINTNAINLN